MAITKAEAQDVTLAFTRDYPSALKLLYAYRETIADLYGPQVEGIPESAKGGYFPKEIFHNGRVYSGRIDVPLSNVSDPGDLLLTLRHEVLGHYGANTFPPGEKRALLDGLAAACNEPTLKPLWDDVNRRYAGQSLDVRSEEVLKQKQQQGQQQAYQQQQKQRHTRRAAHI